MVSEILFPRALLHRGPMRYGRLKSARPSALPCRTKLTPMPPMPTPKSKPAAPLTFDLPVSLIAKIEAIRSDHDLDSASEAVRMALAKFDLDGFTSNVEEHTQISVRIDATTRKGLKRAAKAKDVSVGAILRAALEAVPAKKKR